MGTTIELNPSKPYARRWAALAVLCTAQFMVIMDTSIIGVALPAIQKSLNYSPAALQWIFNAYVIVFGGLLLLGGRLSDLYGPRRVFTWGFAILTAASLLTGLAWSEASMNIGRALQGLGAALIAPSALTLLMMMFTDPKELGRAFGFWGAAAAAGGSAGVFLGGVLTEYFSWRWTFFVNIPVGLIVLGLTSGLLLKGQAQRGRIDYLGALLVTGAMITVVSALVMIDRNGLLSPTTLGLLGLAAVLFTAFVQVQRRAQSPLMPLSIFKAPNLAVSNGVMALMAGAWIPLWFFLNLYLQQVLGLSAFYSGLALLPMTVAIMLLMVGVTGKLIGRFGFKRNLVAGLAALTASLLWFAALPVDGTYWANVLGPSLLGAIGMSLAYIPGTMAAMSGAKPEETGLASGIVNTTYQVGSAIGLAIAVAVAVAVQAGAGEPSKATLLQGFEAAFLVAAVVSGLATVLAVVGVKGAKG